MEQYKTCTKCGQTKPIAFFSPDRRASDKLQSRCKPCQNELVKIRRAKDPEAYRIYQNNWRKANPEKDKAKKQRYRESNRQKERDAANRYRLDNPAKVKQAMQSWRTKNPDKVRAYSTKRRALLKKASAFAISYKEIWRLYNSQCFYCSNPSQTMDHVIPLSRGGRHSMGNLVPCCSQCNNSKNNKFVMEWKKVRGW